jgi:ribokinase
MHVVVFGSINMDLVARTPRLPGPGETILGRTFQTAPGGKGANQAVACARLGVETRMVGRVGGDVFGAALLEQLDHEKVDRRLVQVDRNVSSGVALISVDDAAENCIIVVPGANHTIGERDRLGLDKALEGADSLLLQLEIPMESVIAAAEQARRRGVRVILDPAPAAEIPSDLYPLVDILTPNRTEAAALVGFPVETMGDAAKAAKALVGRGIRYVIIKMGGEGAYLSCPEEERHYPAYPVEPVDTVAAGDAFNGALAAALCEGLSFEQAMAWALAGGALAVTKPGAQEAMPTRQEVLDLLNRN